MPMRDFVTRTQLQKLTCITSIRDHLFTSSKPPQILAANMRVNLLNLFVWANYFVFTIAWAAISPSLPAVSTPDLDSLENKTLAVGTTYEIFVPGQNRQLKVVVTRGQRQFNQQTASLVYTQLTLLAECIRFMGITRSQFTFYGVKVKLRVHVEIEYFNLPFTAGVNMLTNSEASAALNGVLPHFRTNDLAWTVSEREVDIAQGRVAVVRA